MARSLYVEPEPRAQEVEWPALELIDVFRIYRSGPVETVALRGLDLRVEPGEFLAVLGPSGGGKSTMLALAAGLDSPSAGEVRAFGRSLPRMGESELAAYRAQEVAIVFQSDNLWSALSAQENVEISLRLGDCANPEGAAAALEAFGLGERRAHRAAELSGGEQQRVAIAAAAARNARLVLADEPTGELDRRNEQVVLDALARLQREHGATVIVVTHSAKIASSAGRVVELRDGRVV